MELSLVMGDCLKVFESVYDKTVLTIYSSLANRHHSNKMRRRRKNDEER